MTNCTTLVLAAATALTWLPVASVAATPPPNGGTIAIEPRTADGEYDPSEPSFVDAAAQALAARGFTVLDDPNHAAYVAKLILSRTGVGTALAKNPTAGAAVVPGAAVGVGAGVTVPFSTGKSSLVPLQRTRLELSINKRGEQSLAWHGAAVTIRAAGTREGADAKVASDLSEAVLQAYPAQSADVVGVP